MSLLAVLAPALARADGGRALFDARGCRSCHRVGRSGGDAGPDLTLAGLRRSPEWLDLWLTDPHGWKPDTRMPRPGLKGTERAALAAFLSRQRGQAWGGRPPWLDERDPARRGERIYRLAGCVACHGPGGRGGHPNNNVRGGVVPALAALIPTYSDEELKARIRRGSVPAAEDPSAPEPLVRMPAWRGVLSEPDLDALSRYLRTLDVPPSEEW